MTTTTTPRGDALRRAARTLLDVLLAAIAAGLIDAFLVDLDQAKRASLTVFLTAAISLVKNALEDRGTIPAVLKAPASSGANPVPDEGADSTAPGGPDEPGAARLGAEEYPPEDRAGY